MVFCVSFNEWSLAGFRLFSWIAFINEKRPGDPRDDVWFDSDSKKLEIGIRPKKGGASAKFANGGTGKTISITDVFGSTLTNLSSPAFLSTLTNRRGLARRSASRICRRNARSSRHLREKRLVKKMKKISGLRMQSTRITSRLCSRTAAWISALATPICFGRPAETFAFKRTKTLECVRKLCKKRSPCCLKP